MSMNVKSRALPLYLVVKNVTLPWEAVKSYSDLPLCCVKFMLTLPFWAGKKLMALS